MFSLVPWKKKNGREIAVGRQQDWHPLARLEREFDELWNRFYEGWPKTGLGNSPQWGSSGWGNELEERKDEYVFHADLPGFEPDEIKVEISGKTLTISAEHREHTKKSGYQFGRYQQSVSLPAGAETEKIDARYHNGVLEVHMPKEKNFLGRRIEVRSA